MHGSNVKRYARTSSVGPVLGLVFVSTLSGIACVESLPQQSP